MIASFVFIDAFTSPTRHLFIPLVIFGISSHTSTHVVCRNHPCLSLLHCLVPSTQLCFLSLVSYVWELTVSSCRVPHWWYLFSIVLSLIPSRVLHLCLDCFPFVPVGGVSGLAYWRLSWLPPHVTLDIVPLCTGSFPLWPSWDLVMQMSGVDFII